MVASLAKPDTSTARLDLRHRQAADRTRRWEIRKKAGLGILRIEVPLGPLADQLVADKFLGEWDTENRTELERALQHMLAIYVRD